VPNLPSPTSNGLSLSVFITDQDDTDIAYLESSPTVAMRAWRTDSLWQGHWDEELPFQGFAENAVWLALVLTAQDLLAWTQRLCLTGDAQRWNPNRLRYRLLHVAGRLARSGRRVTLHLQTLVAVGARTSPRLQSASRAPATR